MDDDDALVPQLAAYRHRHRYKVWCEFCEIFHIFQGVGYQASRCPQYTPYSKGVILVDAGPWTPMKVTRYSNRKL
jgi:hypothetical protein